MFSTQGSARRPKDAPSEEVRYLAAVLGVIAGLLSFQGPAAADTYSDPGFANERVATVAPYTLVGMAFAPDGRMFVWQKNGIVRVIKNGRCCRRRSST